MKTAIILGTRPEIIKMAPIIRELGRRGEEYSVLHTGQHYSHNLDRVFFDSLNLPLPDFNLQAGSGSHAEETARMLIGLEAILKEQHPDTVLVEGDTNSVLAGALTAVKLGIKVGHVEAGLRSFDRTMPEEINRIVADHISNLLFAPTATARDLLLKEGLDPGQVHVTGNTIVDAVFQNRELAKGKSKVLERLGLRPDGYFLVTLHRQENVDVRSRFGDALDALARLGQEYRTPVVFPMHPRTRKQVDAFQLPTTSLTIIEPMDYLDFLHLESQARLILTDSGGVQEEACILKKPCVTLRDNTERPETVACGANILAGTSWNKICEGASIMLGRPAEWQNPFGEGDAAVKIIDILERS